MRVVVYTDSIYRDRGGIVYGELSFTLFQAALDTQFEEVTVIGRLDPGEGIARYPLPEDVGFLGLPFYESLSDPLAALSSIGHAVRLFWRLLDRADCVWLFGPYLHALLFAGLTLLRRRRLVLGVRQDFPAYVRSRRPGLRWMHVAADVLEWSWRLLARAFPVVVVGEELQNSYGRSGRSLPITVSLTSGADIAAAEATTRSYDDGLTILSVGRLDEEKNPLLLADVLARLREHDPRWRMIVCGDGPLEAALAQRLATLGVGEAAELRGHVPLHAGLMDLYRSCHVLLHVSWTEGFPQVLTEAFASGIPVVATDVGGVAAGAGDAAVLIPPGSAEAAAAAVSAVARDAELRRRLVQAGFAHAREHTLEREVQRAADFIRGA